MDKEDLTKQYEADKKRLQTSITDGEEHLENLRFELDMDYNELDEAIIVQWENSISCDEEKLKYCNLKYRWDVLQLKISALKGVREELR